MKSKIELSDFLKQLLICALIVVGGQFLSAYLMYNRIPFDRDFIGHTFIFALTFLGYLGFVKLRTKFPEYTAYIFGGISIAKMFITAVFLLPFILKEFDVRIYFVMQFMIIYMIYLILEVVTLLKVMKE